MSYQVIARKYRPQRFEDVVGQDHVTKTLSQAIAQNRIAHAYLFCGPRGTGKTTIARIFAKCLNCTGGPRVDFEEKDPNCLEIAEGRAMDVLEIDGASNNGVEQVRELRETVKYAPASFRFKIYIIDEVHMLSVAAFNALLKTLEEPPGHVKFLFATTDPEKVLPTILSRCQRFDLRRIPVTLIVKQLKHIASREKVKVDDAALYAIARGADGGMRDAESALDQLISFCGNKIVEDDVLSMYGLTAQGQLLALSKAIIEGAPAAALKELDGLARSGKDLGRLLADLLRHFRNMLIYQVSGGDAEMLEASETEVAALAEQASRLAPEALSRIMEVLSACELDLRDASSKKILVEIALLKCIQARNALNLDTVLRQLQQLRAEAEPVSAPVPAAVPERGRVQRTAGTSASAERPGPVPAPSPAPLFAPAPEAQPASGGAAGLSSEELELLWARLVEAAQRASPFVRSYLLEAHPVALVNRILTIGFDPEFKDHVPLLDNAKNHALLETKLHELGHSNCQVKIVVAEPPPGRSPVQLPTASQEAPGGQTVAEAPVAKTGTRVGKEARSKARPEPANVDAFKNDPLINKALEVFRGTIAEVRA